MKPISPVPTSFNVFWRYPGPKTPKHQKALWTAAMGSIALFLYSLGTTILMCMRPHLWVQFTTVCTLAATVPQSLIRCIAPSRHNKSEEGCDVDCRFLSLIIFVIQEQGRLIVGAR